MLYMTATFNGRTMFIGNAQNFDDAFRIADNVTELFSDGSPNPQKVTVTVETMEGEKVYSVTGYNGYFTGMYSNVPLIAEHAEDKRNRKVIGEVRYSESRNSDGSLNITNVEVK